MSKIEQLKKDYNLYTSEGLFNLEHPVSYQCQKFDEVVRKANIIQSATQFNRYDDEDDIELLKSRLSDIDYYSELANDIEELRGALEEVRAWGQSWKNFAKNVIENNDVDIEKLI